MKHLKIAAAAVMCLTAGILSAQQIAKDGKAVSEIINENQRDSLILRHAGEELSLWLSKVTGTEIPVVSQKKDAAARIHLVAPESSANSKEFVAKHAVLLKQLDGTDGFAIIPEKDDVYIYGSCEKGVLNGVYAFLDRNTDLVFVRPMQDICAVYNSDPDLKNVIDQPVVVVPAFKYRQFRHNSPVYEARLMCMPLEEFWKKPQAECGAYWETRLTIRGSIEGLEHPDWFALRGGKRQLHWYGQLCYTNKELQKFYRDRTESIMKGQPKKLTGYSVNHSDNWDVCNCPECLKPITLKDGTVLTKDDPSFRTTQFFRFYSSIIDDLHPQFPDNYLIGFAYVWSAPPPKEPISPYILADFAPYVKNHKIPVYDPKNDPWCGYIDGWVKIHKNIRVYEYYLCTTTPLFPNPVGDIAALDLRYYAKNGVKGMQQDCQVSDNPQKKLNANFMESGVFDASAIEFWVISRLYWDPAQDPEKLRDEFCRRAYGEAAAPMRAFYRKIRELWHQSPAACYWNDDPVSSYRRYVAETNSAAELFKYLDEAEAKSVNPVSKELIKRTKAHFAKLREIEATLPKRTTVEVPYVEKVPVDLAGYDKDAWKNAGIINEFRIRKSIDKMPQKRTEVKVLHDRNNLYCFFKCQDFTAQQLDFLKSKDVKAKAKDVWPHFPYIEFFFDGDQRDLGGYYQLAFDIVGGKYDARGLDSKYENDAWTVEGKLIGDELYIMLKLPLESFGRNINLGNKFNVQIYRPDADSTWLGGNVHDSGRFQELLLKMN